MSYRETASTQEQFHAPLPRMAGEKYNRILDAAVAVIAEKGFHVARVSDVAKRAGVADGTIYLYFKNKEELLMAAINTAFDAFVKNARVELDKLTSPSEKLRKLAILHLGALGANRNLAVVFQMELRQSARLLKPFSHEHMVEYFALVSAAIREGQQNALFRPDIDEKIAANCFFGALDEMVTSWVLANHDYSLEDAAVKAADVILHGLKS